MITSSSESESSVEELALESIPSDMGYPLGGGLDGPTVILVVHD